MNKQIKKIIEKSEQFLANREKKNAESRKRLNEIEVRVSELKRLEKEAVRNSDSNTFAKLHAEQTMLESEKETIFSVIDERNRETLDGDFMGEYKKIISIIQEDVEKSRKEVLPFCKKYVEHCNKSNADIDEIIKGVKLMEKAYKPNIGIVDVSRSSLPPESYFLGNSDLYLGALWIVNHIEEGYNGD